MATVAAGTAEATLPAVVDAMLVPDAESAASVHTDVAALAAGRPPPCRRSPWSCAAWSAVDWRVCSTGPRPTGSTCPATWSSSTCSALYASPALGLLMTCATAWLQAALQNDDGIRRLVVIDEAWAVLSNQAILFSQGSCDQDSRYARPVDPQASWVATTRTGR